MVEVSTFEQRLQLHLSPNRSATWRQTKYLIMVFALFIGLIAIAWSIVGAWVILPFAGLEVGLLALVMYLVSKATYRWETILVMDDRILISCSNGTSLCFPRPDTSLFYQKDTSLKRISRLILQTPVQQFELGAFLNSEDKKQVHDSLHKAGVMVCTNTWW
ncbi:DUF2244 domain-containing protein [Alteromonas sp. BL110]|uniref:DUF2244 domain-containing protein n=1 Tax=Alteromonas sp. BL110 TaxID=1714845 RepID=UPI000E4DDF34|nr:DUF2244 domain-containing protein [Alteromonas sp. BL110]AXT39838.1 DUF2244 domain-containing protein [Alteromonas sp. BL110]RKM79067.1 DUF2244 domain-containing protein [Alteromonas sp. BL110]